MLSDAPDCLSSLRAPFNMVVAGPSQVGKTTFVHRLLRSNMINPTPDRIVYAYGELQPSLEDLRNTPPHQSAVELHQGWSSSITEDMKPSQKNLLVLDDVMNDCRDDTALSNLFIRGGHHRNISVIFLTQNYFFGGRSAVDVRRNTHYLVLFACKQDRQQIASFAQRVLPRKWRRFLDAYEEATSTRHGHLLVDMSANCPDKYMLRANILDQRGVTVFVI